MNEPAFEARPAQPYVGKRVIIAMSELEERVPALTQEVAEWMGTHGLKPSGPSFLRYLVIDMPDRIDVEVVFPVDELPDIDGPVLRGTLPARRYAEVTFTGVENGIQANKRLIEWIDTNRAKRWTASGPTTGRPSPAASRPC